MPRLAVLLTTLAALAACGGSSPAPASAPAGQSAPAASAGSGGGPNVLTMKINGRDWTADGEVFGAFHPPGMNKAIVVSGTRGPKDKTEQAFNLNLYNADGPGTYAIATGNADQSVVQLGNLTPENFLYGSMMGFTLEVVVTTARSNPTVIEATFSGEMKGNAGDTLAITDGRFVYRE